MRILNCMWSAEAAFKSVHLVHSNFIAAIKPEHQTSIFLMGDASKQKDLEFAESLHSNKKATRKILAAYFLRRKWLSKIQQIKPDVVILDGLGMARLLLPVLEKYKQARVLIYFHGQTRFQARDLELLNKQYSFSLKLIAVSKTLAAEIREKLPLLPVLAIPTYLNLPAVKIQPIIESELIVFGAVGRLVAEKNFTVLIDCMAQLRDKGVHISLNIAGEGKLRNELQEKINQLGLIKQIKLLGHTTDIASFYQNIDLLLVPSLQEGQGLVLQEAIHYGVPVICSDLLVFKEPLADSGVYCAAIDSEQWSRVCAEHIPAKVRRLLFERQQLRYQQYNNAELFNKNCLAAVL
ncbi:MAG: glycosyltransferase [Gammaproteobacteria bacterium]|nr:glycosyltransferase [Gammaproteobacteria bacterium]